MTEEAIRPRKISEIIARRLEAMILEGSLTPGQKMPPERELALQFEVSRPSLREALQKLEAKGLVNRRQGGGTFVSENIGISFADPLMQLFQTHSEFNYDLLEFRNALEEVAAHYAALRATAADHQMIEQAFEEWRAVHEEGKDEEKESELDWRFHLSIAEASHNAVLLHSMRAIYSMAKLTISSNLQYIYSAEHGRDDVMNQHLAIKNAIMARDPEAAQQSINNHLAFVEETLQESSRFESRSQRSLRRRNLMA